MSAWSRVRAPHRPHRQKCLRQTSTPVPEFGQRGDTQDVVLRASRVQIPPGVKESNLPYRDTNGLLTQLVE